MGFGKKGLLEFCLNFKRSSTAYPRALVGVKGIDLGMTRGNHLLSYGLAVEPQTSHRPVVTILHKSLNAN